AACAVGGCLEPLCVCPAGPHQGPSLRAPAVPADRQARQAHDQGGPPAAVARGHQEAPGGDAAGTFVGSVLDVPPTIDGVLNPYREEGGDLARCLGETAFSGSHGRLHHGLSCHRGESVMVGERRAVRDDDTPAASRLLVTIARASVSSLPDTRNGSTDREQPAAPPLHEPADLSHTETWPTPWDQPHTPLSVP